MKMLQQLHRSNVKSDEKKILIFSGGAMIFPLEAIAPPSAATGQ